MKIHGHTHRADWGDYEPRETKARFNRPSADDRVRIADAQAREQAPRPNDASTALADIASQTRDPSIKRIFSAANGALRRSPVQIRIDGRADWPEQVYGTIRRRFDERTNQSITTFIPDTGASSEPLIINDARGIAHNTRVHLVRDRDAGPLAYAIADAESVVTHSMIGQVVDKGGKTYLKALTSLSAFPELPFEGAAKPGDTVVAEVLRNAEGKAFAAPDPDPRWQGLSAERIRALKIVVDEAGIDVVVPKEVRDATTEILASKPLTLEALQANGYEDLTAIAFFSTDNPDKPGGTPSKDFDQAIALEPRPEGGFVLYRALADPAYFVDFFPKDGVRNPVAQRALSRQLTAYFHPDDAPIYDRRFCEGAMSLNQHVIRPSFVMRMEIDANGRMVYGDDGRPKCDIVNAAVKVRHNGDYWSAQELLDGGNGNALPADYRAFWENARQFGELAGVVPRGEDDLLSKAIESQFSRISNAFIGHAIGALLEKHGLAAEGDARLLSRVQAPPEPERMEAYEDIVRALGLELPPPPAFHELIQRLDPNDDRWPVVADILGLPTTPPSAIYDALADIASSGTDPREEDLTYALWTRREASRLLIDSEANPRLADILGYNYIRRQHKAVLSANTEGHYDVGVLHYGWVTAPMRRFGDTLNMELYRALEAGDIPKAKLVLAELIAFARAHEGIAERLESANRSIRSAKTADDLAVHVGKSLSGYVRHIALEGVEITLPQVGANVTISMKALKAQRQKTPQPVGNGTALELDGEPFLAINDDVSVRVVEVNPETRRMRFELV